MMKKDFDSWNKIKKHRQDKNDLPLFSEREVWWCALGVNVGSEEDGKGKNYLRPVLILRKFNRSIFYGLPITSKSKEDTFHIPIDSGNIKGSIILSQMRLIDARRLSHRMAKITGNELAEVKKKLKGLFP
jgi:mRNA interferase MazF